MPCVRRPPIESWNMQLNKENVYDDLCSEEAFTFEENLVDLAIKIKISPDKSFFQNTKTRFLLMFWSTKEKFT